jgi:hypothetical protein
MANYQIHKTLPFHHSHVMKKDGPAGMEWYFVTKTVLTYCEKKMF